MAAKDDVGPDRFSLSTWARKGSFLSSRSATASGPW